MSDNCTRPVSAVIQTAALALLFLGLAFSSELLAEVRERGTAAFEVTQPVPPGLAFREFVYDGKTRTYYVSVPDLSRFAGPRPLVMAFHGGHSNAVSIANTTRMHELGRERGFIVVYPEAVPETRNWNDGRSEVSSGDDDLGFVAALLDHLKALKPVDPQRLFATGGSNGALMTLYIACRNPEAFRAYATVVGNLAVEVKPVCEPEVPVSLLMINGTADTLMPFGGGEVAKKDLFNRGEGLVYSVQESINFWRTQNGCSGPPVEVVFPPAQPDDGTLVDYFAWLSCPPAVQLGLYVVVGGGHAWPGAEVDPELKKAGVTTRVIDATEVIWEFFSQY